MTLTDLVVFRMAHQEAVERCQAAQLAAEAAAAEKIRLSKDLSEAQGMLRTLLHSSAEDARAEMLGLCDELQVRGIRVHNSVVRMTAHPKSWHNRLLLFQFKIQSTSRVQSTRWSCQQALCLSSHSLLYKRSSGAWLRSITLRRGKHDPSCLCSDLLLD